MAGVGRPATWFSPVRPLCLRSRSPLAAVATILRTGQGHVALLARGASLGGRIVRRGRAALLASRVLPLQVVDGVPLLIARDGGTLPRRQRNHHVAQHRQLRLGQFDRATPFLIKLGLRARGNHLDERDRRCSLRRIILVVPAIPVQRNRPFGALRAQVGRDGLRIEVYELLPRRPAKCGDRILAKVDLAVFAKVERRSTAEHAESEAVHRVVGRLDYERRVAICHQRLKPAHVMRLEPRQVGDEVWQARRASANPLIGRHPWASPLAGKSNSSFLLLAWLLGVDALLWLAWGGKLATRV